MRHTDLLACLFGLCLAPAAAAWAEDNGPGRDPLLPDPALMTPGARSEARVNSLLAALGGHDQEARLKAAAELKGLGRLVTPLLVQNLRHPDKELARRVRSLLVEMVGAPRPGTEVAGLTVAAALVGLPPDKQSCVPIWLSLKNTSSQPLRYVEVYCDILWVSPERAEELVKAPPKPGSPSRNWEHYFRLLPAGGEVTFLADADLEGAGLPTRGRDPPPTPPALASATRGCVVVRAHIRWPDGDLGINEGYSRYTLASGILDLRHYDPAQATAEERALHDSRNFLALRKWNETVRWHQFMELRDRPLPNEEDDFIDFLRRWGPGNVKGDLVGQWIRTYAEALPAYRRIPFLDRLSRAVNYTWLDNTLIALEYLKRARSMCEIDLAARLSRRLLDAGYFTDRLSEFTIWQLAMSLDEQVHDPARARQLLDQELGKDPHSVRLQFMQHTLEGRQAARRELVAAVLPKDKEEMAWLLATAGRATPQDRELAVELAEAALAAEPPERSAKASRLATAAWAYAARGDYARACELQERALDFAEDRLWQAAYASRLVFLRALRASPGSSLFCASTLCNEQVRTLLVSHLKPGLPLYLHRAVADWLEFLFPNDPALRSGGEPELEF